MGHEGRPVAGAEYHSRAGISFGGQNVIEQVAPAPFPVFLGGGEHPFGPRRDKRVGVDLAMRVRLGDTDLPAPVLEAKDLLDRGEDAQLLAAVHQGG